MGLDFQWTFNWSFNGFGLNLSQRHRNTLGGFGTALEDSRFVKRRCVPIAADGDQHPQEAGLVDSIHGVDVA